MDNKLIEKCLLTEDDTDGYCGIDSQLRLVFCFDDLNNLFKDKLSNIIPIIKADYLKSLTIEDGILTPDVCNEILDKTEHDTDSYNSAIHEMLVAQAAVTAEQVRNEIAEW